MKIKDIIKLYKKEKRHIWTVVSAVSIFFLGLIILWVSTMQIPDLQSFEERKVAESTKIYDRTGEIVLYDVNQGIKRTHVNVEDVSRNIKNAIIAIEDKEFYQHRGIKISSFVRAIFANLLSGSYTQGGSTITQQVVKNTLLTKDKTITRKLKEWVLALKIENVLTKDQILELYLNETPYGGNIYGIEEASKAFFGKPSSDINLAEAAYLAAIPKAPTYYSPYGNHKTELENRKNTVLSEMLSNDFITKDEYRGAVKITVEFKPQDPKGIKAPHFVIFLKEKLVEKYGEEVVNEEGLKIISTIDWKMQEKAEELALKYALENETRFNAENIAIVSLDAKTGQILTMVGSRDYFDKDIDGNFNVALAHRQPGSAFKPIVYATAFTKGYTPDTMLFDLQTEFDINCTPEGKPISENVEVDPTISTTSPCYMPENYDGVYRGPISLRNALAQSINIPAIKTLYLAGLQNSLNTAKNMGIKSLGSANDYGLTLVLGGGEVSLLDMTSAYSVFANGGMRNPYSYILEVKDKNGNILEQYQQNPVQVLDEQVALQITDILSDEEARTPAFGSHSYLYVPGRQIAVKTGTTNDYKDAWIIGYSPQVVVGAWAGNNDNTPMEKKVAGFIIAPLWNAFISEALKNYPNENFNEPTKSYLQETKPVLRGFWDGGLSYFVDKFSKKLATEYTPEDAKEERVVKNIHSILYWLDKNNPSGPKPETPENDSQFNLWEYPIRKWVAENKIIEENESVIPKETDPYHKPEYSPKVGILSPLSSISYEKNGQINIKINAYGRFSIQKINYYWNGDYIGSSNLSPFVFYFTPSEYDTTSSTNELKVVVFDSVLNKTESKINILVKE